MNPISDTTNHQRHRAVRKVTLIGSVVDFLLGVTKIVVGWLANSQALNPDFPLDKIPNGSH